jgi:hypothetical protein
VSRRAPTEFRYWERKDEPAARALRAVGRALLGFDPAPPDDVAEVFASMYWDADPLAEAFADDVWSTRGAVAGRAMLDEALAKGARAVAGAPASLVELFADLETPPAWLDRAAVERGARAFRRWGPDVFRFAGAITLQGYAESSVAKPLALSGGYVGDAARRRFLETASFWIAVSDPGGLEPGAPGRAAALRVRMMHVVVRKRLLAHPEWNLEAWGVPISQADATLTLMGGSFIPGVLMHAMGYRTSAREIEDLMHFWRWVGHLMGVRPRWYPSSLREATQLVFLTLFKGAELSGDDGVRLCQSYATAFAPREAGGALDALRARVEDGLHRGFTRYFLPRSTIRRNALPSAGLWTLAPAAAFPLLLAVGSLRPYVPALDDVTDAVQRRRRERWLARHMGPHRAEFRPGERLTR